MLGCCLPLRGLQLAHGHDNFQIAHRCPRGRCSDAAGIAALSCVAAAQAWAALAAPLGGRKAASIAMIEYRYC
jgi:hypothetical protein